VSRSAALLAAFALTVPAARAGDLRVGFGYATGQLRLSDGPARETHRVTGGHLAVGWLDGPLRYSLGWRLLSHKVSATECRGGDPCDVAAKDTSSESHLGGALVGYDQPWFHAAAGVALLSWPRTGHRVETSLLPAARLRVGPRDLVYAEGSIADVQTWSPGPGRARAGLGAQPGGARVWAGVAWEQTYAVGAAGTIPVAKRLRMGVYAGVRPDRPADLLVMGLGMVYRFGGADAER